jgi:PAS domain S-box-containing protein
MKTDLRKITPKSLDPSGERYQSLLEFVLGPIVIFSMDGLVRYLNSAFTETFGWRLEELKEKHIPLIIFFASFGKKTRFITGGKLETDDRKGSKKSGAGLGYSIPSAGYYAG